MSSNSTKTFEFFKDEVAREMTGAKNIKWFQVNYQVRQKLNDEAAERYATYKAEQAFRDGIAGGVSMASGPTWQQACDAQNKLWESQVQVIINHAWNAARRLEKESGCVSLGKLRELGYPLKYSWPHNYFDDYEHVLNAPTAINPHKKDG